MAIAAAMILLMKMFTIRIAAPVGMHTNGCRMAIVQFAKHLLTVTVKRKRCCLSKNLLQSKRHVCSTHNF
jgi:hypothetical protein